MRIEFSEQEERFRNEISFWLKENLTGPFDSVIGRGGSGDQTGLFSERVKWEQHMGEHGWTCIGWPKQYGGQDKKGIYDYILNEELSRVGASSPGKGVGSIGQTIIHHGSQKIKDEILPLILQEEVILAGSN